MRFLDFARNDRGGLRYFHTVFSATVAGEIADGAVAGNVSRDVAVQGEDGDIGKVGLLFECLPETVHAVVHGAELQADALTGGEAACVVIGPGDTFSRTDDRLPDNITAGLTSSCRKPTIAVKCNTLAIC